MEVPICPRSDIPALEINEPDPQPLSLTAFGRVWWLFFNGLADRIKAAWALFMSGTESQPFLAGASGSAGAFGRMAHFWVACTAAVGLPFNTPTLLTGLTVTLDKPGRWMLWYSIPVTYDAAGGGVQSLFRIDGVDFVAPAGGCGISAAAGPQYAQLSQIIVADVGVDAFGVVDCVVVEVRAFKLLNAGNAFAGAVVYGVPLIRGSLMALFIG